MLNKNGTKKKSSPRNELGYPYLIAAFVFLFNPCINVVDILPDFFGYVFLMKGLSKLADLCPNVADAMASIGRLRWFMLLKTFSMILVPFVDDTYVLIFVFGFAVIELMYALPAAGRIFDGLEYFGTRFDCKTIFKKYKDVRLLTPLFFIVKNAFCLFPELCCLYSGEITSGAQSDLTYYKPLLVELNLIVGTVVGIVWLVSLVRYTKRVAGDTPFIERVLHDYEIEIGSNKGLLIRRRLRTVISTIIVGLVFLPNMWLDGVNFVPTFVCGIFIIAAMLLLRRISAVSKLAVIFPALFATVSAVSFALSTYFGVNYLISDVHYDRRALLTFGTTCVATAVEYALLILTGYFVYRELKRVVAVHLAAAPDITDKRIIEFSADTQRQLNKSLTVGFAAFVAVALINLTYLMLRADVIADLWLCAFVPTVVWIFCIASVMNRLYDQIEYKYM